MKNKDFSDDILIQMCQKGDLKALDSIFKKHGPALKFYLWGLAKNKELVEDLYQDTYLKVISAINTNHYTENGSLKSWLLRIAHNLFIDSCRKENRMPKVSTVMMDKNSTRGSKEELCLPLVSSDLNIEEEIILMETYEKLWQMVFGLPCEQREVVILRIRHEFSFQEVAEYTDVSINTALGRMRYALINMRKTLRKKNRGSLE